MRLLSAIIVSSLIFFSCTARKESIKPKEAEKPLIVIDKKPSLSFSYEILNSKTASSLRGISVVDSLTAWASGSNGIYMRTTDGGITWTDGKVKGFEALDFRDIHAFDKNTAIIMSIDAPAFFFKTTDGGKSWKRKYMNRNPKVFFDGMAFWNEKNGIAFSDPIDDRFFIITTKDGGDTWSEIQSKYVPSALKGEGGFAARGSSIAVAGKDLAWIGTGGAEKSRIFVSQDGGENWRAMDAPIRSGSPSSGVFSISFKDDLYGVAVGGDYKNYTENISNCTVTDDGGLTWQKVDINQPGGFRSCVAWNEKYKFYITTGTSGSDYSLDDGRTWIPIDKRSFNSIGISQKDGSCFMVGDNGAIAKIRLEYKMIDIIQK
ncbi:MAG: hypothetical protein CVV24_05310 [Ignavibacteriae bacterium HGW-Ignavibacteriae-3]|nr:MAG: hypothetical protein CVV24_05310 [Ignavibacteriae bacterium HGW-Ignavibacteriae-3]